MTLDAGLGLIHIVAGASALLIGPIAMWAPKRIGVHSRMGEMFFVAVTAVCISGGWLGVIFWESRAPFVFIALGTFAFALLGYVSAKMRWRRWMIAHVVGQGSAYTGMVTAFIVANWDELTGTPGTAIPAVFLVPMAIGSVAVGWLAYQVHLGNRPRDREVHD